MDARGQCMHFNVEPRSIIYIYICTVCIFNLLLSPHPQKQTLQGLATILSVYTFMVWAQYPVPGASKGGHVQLMTFIYWVSWAVIIPFASSMYLAISILYSPSWTTRSTGIKRHRFDASHRDRHEQHQQQQPQQQRDRSADSKHKWFGQVNDLSPHRPPPPAPPLIKIPKNNTSLSTLHPSRA